MFVMLYIVIEENERERDDSCNRLTGSELTRQNYPEIKQDPKANCGRR